MEGCVEGKGLSVGLHIWEPLAHSCLLSACLWMDLYGTERDGTGTEQEQEGGAGRVVSTGGNPDRSRRRLSALAQRAGRAWGSTAPLCLG